MSIILIKLRFLFISGFWGNNYKKIFASFMAVIGSLWLFIEVVNYFFSTTILNDTKDFWIFIITSAILSVIINLQKLTYRYFIKDKDIKIKLVIGDIFKQRGDIVIATNTTFDTTMKNDFISKNSIQGKLALKYYTKIDHLDSEIDHALNSKTPIEILDRPNSKCKRYSIGTTIKLCHKSFKSYWLALSNVNEYGKPSSNFTDLQIALESLWTFISTNGHMDRLVLPILGSGKSAINASRQKIIKEIIYSFVVFSKEKKITEELVICIFPTDFANNEINLNEINKFLEYHCLYKHESYENASTSVGI